MPEWLQWLHTGVTVALFLCVWLQNKSIVALAEILEVDVMDEEPDDD